MPPSTSITSVRFWSLTMGLLLMWVLVIITTTTSTANALHASSPTSQDTWNTGKDNDEAEKRNTQNCKALCQQCGCMGFYCGEECICEYNKHKSDKHHNDNSDTDADTDTECIANMRRDALKLRIPFEMLIQGPSNNRFVRNALQFDQNADNAAAALGSRNRRSTVVVYKPAHDDNVQLQAAKSQKDNTKSLTPRHKRAIDQLDWFTDLANTLVRPAPLSGSGVSVNRKRETAQDSEEEQTAGEKPESWFTDHSNVLVRPAPLFRRRTTAASSEADDSRDAEVLPMGRVLKDTIRKIQDTDLGETLRSRFRDGADILQNTLDTNNFNFLPQGMREHFVDALLNMQKMQEEAQAPPTTTPPAVAPAAHSQFMIPWFRPVRFLQRVQQALSN